MAEKNEVPNPIQIKMKQDTFDIIAEGDSISAVISAISELQKEIRTSNKLTEREKANQAKWQTENIRYAKGLDAVLKDPKFTSYAGSYRFFNEYAHKLEFTLGKTVGSLAGKLSDETMKKVEEARHIMDSMVRATKGLNRSESRDPNKQHIRDRYDFRREHLRALSQAKGLELDKAFHSIRSNKLLAGGERQDNHKIAMIWKDILGIKPPRESAEARQKTLAEMYMGIRGDKTWVPGIDEIDRVPVPPVPPKLPEEVEKVRDSFISLEEIMSKISITSDDIFNALTKLFRKDMLKEKVEAHPAVIAKREMQRREQEKERREKERERHLKKWEENYPKRLGESIKLRSLEADLTEQFKKLQEKESKEIAKAYSKELKKNMRIEAFETGLMDKFYAMQEKEEENRKKLEIKRTKTLKESIASAAVIIGKTFLELFDSFFNRSATDVAKSITTFLDDPLSSMMDHTEYAVNSISNISQKGGFAMAGIGMGAAALGEASGMESLAGMGKTLGAVGVVAGFGIKIIQGAINAGLGVMKAIYSKLKESSPILQGFVKMFQTAVNLIFMPIGNIMGTFFMMFGMRIINFAVWFNREFPKYQYSILSFMSGGLATIISMFANLSGLFSAGLRVLAYILDPLPGFSGVAFAIRGTADMIDASQAPLRDMASKMFDVSTSSANLHNAISQNSDNIEEFKVRLEEDMMGLTTSMDNLTTAMMEATDAIMSQEPELGWYDNLTKKGGGSFWAGWQTTQEEKGGGSFWKGFAKSFEEVGSKLSITAPIDNFTTAMKEATGTNTFIGGPTGGELLDMLAEAYDSYIRAAPWRKIPFPGRAHGGYIPPSPGGTLVRVGEGTRGEHIIPHGKSGFGNVVTIHVEVKGNLYGDDAIKRTIERSVNDALIRSNVL